MEHQTQQRSSPPESRVHLGDIWTLGDHRLACGDCRDETLLSQFLSPNECVRTILTDPPYGVNYVASKKDFVHVDPIARHVDIANDDISDDPAYAEFTRAWLAPVLGRLVEKNAIYVFNSDKMIFALREGLKTSGVKLAQLLVWVKNAVVIGRLDYLPMHELVAYGWYGKHRFRGSKSKSVLAFPKPRKNDIHPTMKPVELLRELVLDSSERGEIVYDPFGGSGSTLIACERSARKCRMIELDPRYCEAIIARWEKETGKTAIGLAISRNAPANA